MRTLALLTLVPQLALAHFILDAPAANFTQGILGDPQKAPPCGDDGSGSAMASGQVTTFVAGQTVTIKLRETIFHPGHYRVALGVNGPGDLPAEPPVTAGATACGSAPIDPNPAFPVLADGLLQHTMSFSGTQTVEVKLPADVTCTNCTLQVLEFMSSHGLNNPGGCYYHHCATINVVAADAGVMPSDPMMTTKGCSTTGVELLPMLGLAGLWLRRISVRRRRS
ncbi:MAG: SCE4755 family polysaccharide monooxygenase-like protein [Myxococcaceae bacterium]